MKRLTGRSPRLFGIFALVAAVFLLSACRPETPPAPSGERPLGIEEWTRLDLLPRLKTSAAIGCVSSYDRTGKNDDGFSGKYSYIRKEEGGLVIADLEGPGIITRIHTPTPTDDIIEFYFDGETSPRIQRKFSSLFDGSQAPFSKPLVGYGAGGYYSYIPLSYQHSCKVLLKAEALRFLQINYARYPEGTEIPTYQDPPSEAYLRRIEEAGRILRSAGSSISAHLVPEGTAIETQTGRQALPPGGDVTLFKTSGGGRILGLRLGPASAFSGPERDILLNMYWDGEQEPAVSCPVGDFFGYSFGQPAVRSLFLGTSDDQNYVYLPMPYNRSARIELVSQRLSGPPIDVQAEIDFAHLSKAEDEGRFHALWRRENPTQAGVSFTYLKTKGRGHVVGVILQAQGMEPGRTPFFEGDDRAVIDGKLAIPGTGTEDSFNGGYYDIPGRWEARVSLPLSGCLDYQKHLARTGGYRWLITDAYPYTQSIDFTVEHAPEDNSLLTDYTSVTFFYSLEPPEAGSPLPPAADRRVSDPVKIVFVPGRNVPIHSFSGRNATLTKRNEEIGGERVRFLAMTPKGKDGSRLHHISFIFDMPSAGRYRMGMRALRGPEHGIIRMSRPDGQGGDPVNLYAEKLRASEVLPLGTLDMSAGGNVVFLHVLGKDPASRGQKLDLIELLFERME